jgi:hypothetical protein
MTTKYDDAVIALYRAPLDEFVAQRKRLASELKAAGDKTGATRLTGLARPPISAWAVNQLWWEARAAFDELFAAAERLRQGDLAATGAHRDAMTKLRARAEAVLGAAGHATTEATLRRIMTDLSALAAAGTFDPDPPGGLAGDREPVGFDVIGTAPEGAARADDQGRASHSEMVVLGAPTSQEADAARLRQERERLEQERRKAEEEQRRKAEEERARKLAERARLEGELRRARVELDAHTREADRLRSELADVEKTVAQTRTAMAELESRLAGLE